MKISKTKISTNNTEFIDNYKFNQDENCFILSDKNKHEILDIHPKLTLDNEYKLKDYDVFFMHNAREDCTESSIFQVYVGRVRIGWIIPIQALNSDDHDEAENIHFLKYAFVAWEYLLEKCECEVLDFENFDLFNNYSEDINLLVLCKENCSKVKNFCLDNYIVSLFEYGYSYNGLGNKYTPVKKINKNLNLKPHSEFLNENTYLLELFKHQIPLEEEPLSRFYLYYQIVEIFIQQIFEYTFNDIVDELKNTADDPLDTKERLINLTNEKKRINILFNNCGKMDGTLLKILNNKCIEWLKGCNLKIKETMPENMYQIRCHLVHRMYKLDSQARNMLIELDDLFLEVLIQLIFNFKHVPIKDMT